MPQKRKRKKTHERPTHTQKKKRRQRDLLSCEGSGTASPQQWFCLMKAKALGFDPAASAGAPEGAPGEPLPMPPVVPSLVPSLVPTPSKFKTQICKFYLEAGKFGSSKALKSEDGSSPVGIQWVQVLPTCAEILIPFPLREPASRGTSAAMLTAKSSCRPTTQSQAGLGRSLGLFRCSDCLLFRWCEIDFVHPQYDFIAGHGCESEIHRLGSVTMVRLIRRLVPPIWRSCLLAIWISIKGDA